MDYRWTIFAVAMSCKHVATGAELLRIYLLETVWKIAEGVSTALLWRQEATDRDSFDPY